MFSTPHLTVIINFLELPSYKNKNVLRQKYLVEGLTVNEISVLLGCGVTTIKKQLREFGLRKTQRSQHKKNLEYGVKMISGKPQTHKKEAEIKQAILDMHSKEGLSPSSIARLLTQMKIPTKKQGKAWDHSTIIKILKRNNIYKPRGR